MRVTSQKSGVPIRQRWMVISLRSPSPTHGRSVGPHESSAPKRDAGLSCLCVGVCMCAEQRIQWLCSALSLLYLLYASPEH